MAVPPVRRERYRALARYAAGWLVAGIATAVLLIAGLRGCSREALPPLKQANLDHAVRDAGCRLIRADARHPGNPPAYGRRLGAAARPGFYDRPPELAGLMAAVRRGVVVVHFRAPLDDTEREDLHLYRDIVPQGTIVTANPTRMPYRVAAVAWRSVLGCPRMSAATLEALRLFRARNLGQGPDA
jgi:hypothetical protein